MYKIIYKKGNVMQETIVNGQYTKDHTIKARTTNGAKIVRTVRIA